MSELQWDLEADLVVVGFGIAGTSTVLRARELGLSVILIEKQEEARHTPSTRMSGGMIMGAKNAAAAARYLDLCASGMVPPELSAAWADRAVGIEEWLAKLDPELDCRAVNGAEHPDLEGAAAIQVFQPGGARFRLDPRAGGPRLYQSLYKAATDCGAKILWQSPAERLLRNGSGKIEGVAVGGKGGARNVHGKKGVVLTCGGYEFDETAKQNFLRVYPMHFYGNPGNTGDGLRMAQEMGADLWHMNQAIGRAIGHFPMADGSMLNFIITIAPPGYVITDANGERFANEYEQAQMLHGFYHRLVKFDPESGTYPLIPCYWFFDESRRRAGPLTYSHIGAVGVGLYDWSADNAREIAQGWITEGKTIAEAAAKAGLADPEGAARTVRDYNALCMAGRADPFGRPPDTMKALDQPPFYCVKLWPGGSNTTGGPRRDQYARVLDVYGAPIPGLYAAGELGQASGMQYPADGSNLSEGICFGQIAAETASRDGRPPNR